MTNRGEVGLRDQRRPGHCWQDNELLDVFQPIIGPQGVSLYVNLSRMAYGASFEYSARGLEEATGMSRMTVWRTMAVLEHLGMVRVQAARGSARGKCDLMDLKELAEALGARPIQNGKSHELPAAALARLKKECAAVRARLVGAAAATTDAGAGVCVPVGDANSGGKLPFCVPVGDAPGTFVSQNEGVCVPLEGHASFSVSKHKTAKQEPTPTPPGAGGERRDGLPVLNGEPEDAVTLDLQALRVATACGTDVRGVVRAIRGQLAMRVKPLEAPALAEMADRMIAAWREYSSWGEFLRFPWGLRKFFGEGKWDTPALWPIDMEKYSASRGARVGMA